MINKIIKWSVDNRLIMLVLSILFFLWGSWQAESLPVDVFPDLAAPAVTVVVEAHGMAPEEIETQAVLPIETTLNAASGVRNIRSATSIGNSVITVQFDWDVDVYKARQVVAEGLQRVQPQLPPTIEPPIMGPISSVMGQIMFIALSSETATPMQVRTEADWLVLQRVGAIPGVAQVLVLGGDVKQFQVIVSPEKINALGISIRDVVDALEQANENISAGFYEENGREYLIYGLGRIERLDDIGKTLITTRQGVPILVKDVAEFKIGAAFKRGAGSVNGKDAVIIAIHKQPDANTLMLTRQLDRVFDELESALPANIDLYRNLFRQADFIEVAVENVLTALRDGSFLVVFIILIFLVSLRATLITALVIPLSLLVAVLTLQYLGGTINTMTLGGMAIAVGVLVDDGIVVVENVMRRLRLNAEKIYPERQSANTVIYNATREVVSPLFYANLVVFVVFLPLLFLSGIEGRLLEPLGVAFIVAVLASLFIALTITPALCSYLFARRKSTTNKVEPSLNRWLKAGYEPLLIATLPHWKSIAVGSAIAIALAGWGLSRAGKSFLPAFNEGSLTISVVSLPGTSLETSHKIGSWVEDALRKHPEVVQTSRRTGRAERDEHAQEVNASEIEVVLSMKERSKDVFLADLRADLNAIPGISITIEQPMGHRIDHMLSGSKSNIAVKIFGEDIYELRRLAGQIGNLMQEIDGLVDIYVDQQIDIPFLSIDFDREAIAHHGLRVEQVAETIEIAYSGHIAGKIVEGQRSFDLWVQFPDSAKDTIEAIEQILILTPAGAQIPLSALANIQRDRRPNRISRENARRYMMISANSSHSDLVGLVNAIERRIHDDIQLPPGYYVEYGGQFERAKEASQTLLLTSIIAIFAVFILVFMALGSIRDALLVILNLPLALIGGVVGVFVFDGVLSIASMIGFITLFGIAIRNGLLMISHICYVYDEYEGISLLDATRRGAMERLVPILMTALSSGLGLLPLAMQAGQPGGEIQSPMAIVILFGLISSTILNLLVVPALFLRFGSLRHNAKARHP